MEGWGRSSSERAREEKGLVEERDGMEGGFRGVSEGFWGEGDGLDKDSWVGGVDSTKGLPGFLGFREVFFFIYSFPLGF